MKSLIISICCFIPCIAFSQGFYLRDNGMPIDKKVAAALRYDYSVVDSTVADYFIEIFFKPKSGAFGKYSAYYKLYDKTNNELYKSEEWKSGSYGGVSENYFVKKIVDKDLPKALKMIKDKK